MSVFLSYFHLTLQEHSVYRLNFFFWRLRMFSRLLISLFIWKAIFGSVQEIDSYTMETMTSYIVLIHILGATIYSGKIAEIADQINSGALSNLLIKPGGLWERFLGVEISEKILNILFLPFEILLAFVLTGLGWNLSLHFSWIGIFLVLAGIVLFFLISLAMALLGFWTTETWALRFFFMIILDLCSGTFLPLDLYPYSLARIFLALPFAQILYIPTQVFLGKGVDSSQALMVSLMWIGIMAGVCIWLWKRGLKRYSGDGR